MTEATPDTAPAPPAEPMQPPPQEVKPTAPAQETPEQLAQRQDRVRLFNWLLQVGSEYQDETMAVLRMPVSLVEEFSALVSTPRFKTEELTIEDARAMLEMMGRIQEHIPAVVQPTRRVLVSRAHEASNWVQTGFAVQKSKDGVRRVFASLGEVPGQPFAVDKDPYLDQSPKADGVRSAKLLWVRDFAWADLTPTEAAFKVTRKEIAEDELKANMPDFKQVAHILSELQKAITEFDEKTKNVKDLKAPLFKEAASDLLDTVKLAAIVCVPLDRTLKDVAAQNKIDIWKQDPRSLAVASSEYLRMMLNDESIGRWHKATVVESVAQVSELDLCRTLAATFRVVQPPEGRAPSVEQVQNIHTVVEQAVSSFPALADLIAEHTGDGAGPVLAAAKAVSDWLAIRIETLAAEIKAAVEKPTEPPATTPAAETTVANATETKDIP